MAVVRSKIGKMTWKNYKFDGNGTRVPTRDAIILYGDKNVKVEFTADDKSTIQRLMETSPKKVKHLSKQLRLRGPDAKGVMDSLYPRTRAEKIIGRAKAPEPKKEEIKAEPKKEEKPELKPPLTCAECEKELTGKQKKFCSRQCSLDNRKGIKTKAMEAKLDE